MSSRRTSPSDATEEEFLPYYSQYRQDETIDRLLRKTGGVFIEIGAYDGVTYSNTCYFEREKEWTGICVEPVPELFEQVQANRNCVSVQGCISNSQGVKTFRRCHGHSEMLSGLVDFYDDEHRQRIDREIDDHGGSWEEFDVQCYTLGELLDQHGFQTVDYCSIDTEGGELEILGTIDFEKYRVRALSIEDNYEDQRIAKFMRGKGYSVLCRNSCDLIFVRNLSEFLWRPSILMLIVTDRLKQLLRRNRLLYSALIRMKRLAGAGRHE